MKKKIPVVSMMIDFCAALVYVFGACPDAMGGLHPVLKALICAAAAVLIYLLTIVPFLGKLFQLSAGAALSCMIYISADVLGGGAFASLKERSVPLWLFLTAVMTVLCISAHWRRTLGERLGVQFADNRHANSEEDYTDEELDLQAENSKNSDSAPDNYESDDINANIRLMSEATDCYNAALEETRSRFGAIKSGDYVISEEQLTVIGGVAEELEELINKASDIFKAFDDDGGQTDMSQKLLAVAERMESLASVMRNIIGKLPRAEQQKAESGDPDDNGSADGSAYFSGCKNSEDLKKRYKSLSKIFHPDTETGDTESMQRINDEFERLKKAFRKKK